MPTTYQAIATVTVSTATTTSFQFTSIPSTYTDLLLKLSLRTTAANVTQYISMTFNGNSSNIYSDLRLQGEGSGTPASYTNSNINEVYFGTSSAASATANTFSNIEIYIPNYTSSANKILTSTCVAENNGATSIQWTSAGVWANSAAISSITLSPATYVQYTSGTLYGIKNS